MSPAMAVQLHGDVGFTGPACTSKPSFGTSAATAAGFAGRPPGLVTVHQPCCCGASALATVAVTATTTATVGQAGEGAEDAIHPLAHQRPLPSNAESLHLQVLLDRHVGEDRLAATDEGDALARQPLGRDTRDRPAVEDDLTRGR